MEALPSPDRLTSSLAEAQNDTGRTAFCGPYVLSAITGYPISKIEDLIRSERGTRARRSSKAPAATRLQPRSPSSATT